MQIPADVARTSATVQGIKVQNPILFPDGCLDASADFFKSIGVQPNVAAAVLQNVLVVENPRNNIAQSVKDQVYGPALVSLGYVQTDEDGNPVSDASGNPIPDWAAAGSAKENLSELEDDVKAALAAALDIAKAQELVDEYLAAYIPGQPRRSSGSQEVIDPVENQARKLAREAIGARMANQAFSWDGVQYSGVSLSARAKSYKAADAKMQAEKETSLADWLEEKVSDTVENRPYFTEQAKRMLDEAAQAAGELEDSSIF